MSLKYRLIDLATDLSKEINTDTVYEALCRGMIADGYGSIGETESVALNRCVSMSARFTSIAAVIRARSLKLHDDDPQEVVHCESR